MKISPDGFYLHAYLAFLLLVSFTTMEIYRSGIFPVVAITLYLIDLYKNERDQEEIEQNKEALSETPI